MRTKRLLIVAGGTGGHVFPGLAVAEAFRQLGHSVFWMGTRQGIEARVIPDADIELFCIDIRGVRGKGIADKLKAPFRILRAIGQSLRLLRKIRPDVLLCMGGFVSGPAGIAAKLLGIPLVIHEQNAIAGSANRLLSRVATRILMAFPEALPGGITVGNPVRASILEINHSSHADHETCHLLVIGGSQGAKAINELMPRVFPALGAQVFLWHQVGPNHIESVTGLYGDNADSENLRLSAFIENMDEAYQWADLVICRSGAMTVSELAIAGKAAVLVPLPNAIDDHQMANARWLSDEGAAVLLPQSEMTEERLTEVLTGLIPDRGKLRQMAEKSRLQARPEATADVVNHCLEVAL